MKKILTLILITFSSFCYAFEPSKPITVYMNMPAGSPSDNSFRIISSQVEKNTGVRFVINYRLGAGGSIGNEAFVKSAADGYNIAQISLPGVTATDRMVNPNKSYTLNDFVFVTSTAFTPMTIIANASDPVNSLQDLIKVLKNEKTTMGDPGSGGRIAYELFRSSAKLEERDDRILRAEYRGPVEVVQDVAGKNIRFGIVPLATSIQMHLVGKIKIIAVTSESRWPTLPNIPTVNSMFPGMVYNLGWAVSLPRDATPEMIAWYNREFNKALQNPEIQKVLQENFFFVDTTLLNSKNLTSKVIEDEKKFAPIVDKVVQQIHGKK